MKLRTRILLACALLGATTLAAAAGFSFGNSSQQGFLKADQAFQLQAPTWQGSKLQLHWKIAPGYYLYRKRIHVKPKSANARPGTLELPPAQAHEDAAFGKVHIYRGQLTADYIPASASHPPQQLEVTVQGCADRGICYPPMTHVISVPPTASHNTGKQQ